MGEEEGEINSDLRGEGWGIRRGTECVSLIIVECRMSELGKEEVK